MKKGIHPEEYRPVVFKDVSCDYAFLTRSTVSTNETIKWEDGNEYPLFKLEISDHSHPFYTGKMKFVDTAGRVDKFFAKYGKKGAVDAKAEVTEPSEEVKAEVVEEVKESSKETKAELVKDSKEEVEETKAEAVEEINEEVEEQAENVKAEVVEDIKEEVEETAKEDKSESTE